MTALLNFILRIVLLAAGLVLAASMAAGFVLMLTIWGVRTAWFRLTGRPATPFIIRIDPRRGFERMYRRSDKTGRRKPHSGFVRPARNVDVTDVEPKAP
jgi:hypothetical protein